MRFFFTFGEGQFNGALANSYIEVEAPDEMTARKLVGTTFNGKWSGIYTESEFAGQPQEYGLRRLVLWDEQGNVLERW